jgi:uncharacterized protein (TIGR03118 family)
MSRYSPSPPPGQSDRFSSRLAGRTAPWSLLPVGFAFLVLTVPLTACNDSSNSTPAPTQAFQQVNLVADTAAIGGAGATVDPDLQNPWGISFAPGSPFWISDNHSGKSTLYDGVGVKQGLVVAIPGPGNTGVGSPTGTVFNSTSDFTLPGGAASHFLFATEDGTLYGWGGGTTAVQVADNSSSTGAVYKALALDSTSAGNFLYATDFHNARVDVFNGTFAMQPASAFPFADPNIPAGFAPFGIHNIGGNLFVTYAKQDAAGHDDVKGAGNGFVDEFNSSGVFMHRVASNGQLNSPWGVTLAPATFGPFGGDLLVGNFGDGRITAFPVSGGSAAGQLRTANGATIAIDGLWEIVFGAAKNADPAALYFTAGPNGENDGLFGKLAVVNIAVR